MSVLFPLVVLPLVALTLIVLGAIWLTNLLAAQVVGQKHHILEAILNDGEIPQQWNNDLTSRILSRISSKQQQQTRLHKRALHKLDELRHYVHTTTLVADEETRAVLVERLAEVRADWASRQPDYV